MLSEETILQKLKEIKNPSLGLDIVTLGYVHKLAIEGDRAFLSLKLKSTDAGLKDQIQKEAEEKLSSLPTVEKVQVDIMVENPPNTQMPEKSEIPGVKHIIAVGSGKGGVGKSTVAANLAAGLTSKGFKVGLLDADIYGPSVPMMLGTHDQLKMLNQRILPALSHGIKIMSMGFMADGDKPLIWRGPMAHKAMHQSLFDVEWGELDYLVVDLPPGTGDVHLTLAQSLRLTGAVIVSTPQDVGLTIARKTLRMFQTTQVAILGVVENMSYHICGNCGSREHLFGHGLVRETAKELKVPFLGEIPLDMGIREASDEGKPVVIKDKDAKISKVYQDLIQRLLEEIKNHSQTSEPASHKT